MDAVHVDAAAADHRRGAGGLEVALGGVVDAAEAAEERLAGDSDDERAAEGAQPGQRAQEREVVLEALAEADARVDRDALGCDAGRERGARGFENRVPPLRGPLDRREVSLQS